ncbi:PPC domain-containing DNA-binding protein [Buttiauxella noackiae]|uniref:PPC domain-containing DNA-binding protein n=1 Tax=Buttiauxella noackiae TaxID=82992 RepID=UPI000554549E|nr:PPC domain-containing DNA-binding protein [Buttiauxella noackiae]
MVTSTPSTARFYALRLIPQQELLSALRDFIRLHGLHAAWISGCVGSLSEVAFRYAGREETTLLSGKFEVVSLIGTLEEGGEHLHLSVADKNGQMTGGHVMDGCLVRTTLELVIGELNDLSFNRQPCALSGYDELSVTPRHIQNK